MSFTVKRCTECDINTAPPDRHDKKIVYSFYTLTHLTKFRYFKPFYAPLVMVSHSNELKYISGYTVFHDGSNDTPFDPPSVLLEITFNFKNITMMTKSTAEKKNVITDPDTNPWIYKHDKWISILFRL